LLRSSSKQEAQATHKTFGCGEVRCVALRLPLVLGVFIVDDDEDRRGSRFLLLEQARAHRQNREAKKIYHQVARASLATTSIGVCVCVVVGSQYQKNQPE
jgi:hypothetical protein